MTSPREAVSILTAAALVVAPVGGVAATYTTGYAEDGDGPHDHGRGPDSGQKLRGHRWLDAGKTLYKSTVHYMKAHAGQFGNLTEEQLDKLEGQAPMMSPLREAGIGQSRGAVETTSVAPDPGDARARGRTDNQAWSSPTAPETPTDP